MAPATMENLPGDALSNIFMRLLAKQLAQMRCVSKTWNDLLCRPSFVKSHLHRSIHKNDEVLLVFYGLFSFHSKPFTAHPSESPHLELTNFIKLPSDLQSKHTSGKLIGSVNGLLCLECDPYFDSGYYYIWNPSLSALLTLPPTDMPYYDYDDFVAVDLQFGFDPKTDDYKVVKLISLQPPEMPQPILTKWLAEVYSMRKGFFRFIFQSPSSRIGRIAHDNSVVCVDGYDGHLHWFGYPDSWHKPVAILAFDLSAETFNEISIPDLLLDGKMYGQIYLGVLDGKLCIMAGVAFGKYEVWVMDEYGVVESWVRNHVISIRSCIQAPYGFTLHNEFLFEFFDNGLALYDPVAAKIKTFKIKSRKPGRPTKVVGYVDSLVWITPPKKQNRLLHQKQLRQRISIEDFWRQDQERHGWF